MKIQPLPKQARRMFLCCLAMAAPVQGTELSDAPVVTSTTTAVKPNLMFILDDSGSMDWDYLPDWANTSTESKKKNPDYNGVAYNPARTYSPPPKSFNADGSVAASYASQTAANTNNWTQVKDDGYGVQSLSTTDLTVAADKPVYFVTKAGEYCKKPDLRSCNAQSESSADYPEPAKLRWCDTSANASAESPAANSCQAVYIENKAPNVPGYYYNARFPSPYTATITLNGNNNTIVSSVKVDGQEILSGATAASNNTNTVAASIRDKINACKNAKVGNCAVIGYSASASGGTVTVYAPADTNATLAITINGMAAAFTNFAPGTVPGVLLRTVIDPSNNSYPYPGTAAKASGRGDCAGDTCTYAEEMTNYANWWAYYRTRMQMMKSATGIAFASVEDSLRMGYISINFNASKDFLNIGLFDNAQKNAWYAKLFAATPSSTTPLRAALSRVGRLYAGKLKGFAVDGVNAADPVEYSCQQNFSLLSTDGYWNENVDPKQVDNATDMGNQDGTVANTAGIVEVRPRLDGSNTDNTLADVAEYYYTNDLRQSAAPFNNCTGALGKDVCDNNVPKGGTDDAIWQHLTTFTLGLGASGYMQFDPNYASAPRGDFYSLGNDLVSPKVAPAKASLADGICTWLADGKTCDWPIPVSNEQPNIDDLWHAAVNGRGSYYSAGNPEALATGLNNLLDNIDTRTGAEAAAVTSNPNVIADDNFLFGASFTTIEWSGELDRRTMNPGTGTISATPDWTARGRLDGKAADTDPDPAAYDNTRTIYYVEPANKETSNEPLRNFKYENGLTESAKSYFSQDYISSAAAPFGRLTQYCAAGTTCLSDKAKADAAGKNLVNFLRGERTNEGALSTVDKYYRQRKHVLGDIVNADPLYIKGAVADYDENGYQNFKNGVAATHRGMIYVAANDGMLHAFNAENIPAGCDPNAGTCTYIGGDEAWAHIPSFVLPNLYKLADKQYARNHRFYVDASPTVGDIYDEGDATWKTILVGGLGKGGKGYYALDITDPGNPKALWEFAPATMGYSYGNPIITKVNKKWVVLLASGYNNADGVGRLYVVDANTGTLEKTLSTGQGTAVNPSGLARISAWIDDAMTDNYAQWAYGGDVLGNLFRFDLEAGTVQRMATLTDGVKPQPITARPELGEIAGIPVVFIGTGRYLHSKDSDNSQQSFYAIKDRRDATDYGDPRGYGGFVEQTVKAGTCPETQPGSCVKDEPVRMADSNNAVDFGTDNGWYLDLPLGEKANTDPVLVYGTLVFNTNLPTATACSYGGSSYRYFLNYATGGNLSNAKNGVISSVLLGGANGKDNVLASRAVIVSIGSGSSLVQLTRLSDGTTRKDGLLVGSGLNLTRRSSWRELITD